MQVTSTELITTQGKSTRKRRKPWQKGSAKSSILMKVHHKHSQPILHHPHCLPKGLEEALVVKVKQALIQQDPEMSKNKLQRRKYVIGFKSVTGTNELWKVDFFKPQWASCLGLIVKSIDVLPASILNSECCDGVVTSVPLLLSQQHSRIKHSWRVEGVGESTVLPSKIEYTESSTY